MRGFIFYLYIFIFNTLRLFLNRLVQLHVLASGPSLQPTPRLPLRGPEGVVGRQSEWQEYGSAEVEATGGDVGFGTPNLVARKAECKPTALVKVALNSQVAVE